MKIASSQSSLNIHSIKLAKYFIIRYHWLKLCNRHLFGAHHLCKACRALRRSRLALQKETQHRHKARYTIRNKSASLHEVFVQSDGTKISLQRDWFKSPKVHLSVAKMVCHEQAEFIHFESIVMKNNIFW